MSSVVEHAAGMAGVARRQPTRAVHEWRKSLRRARALLRLARPVLDDPIRQSVNASLRTAQRAASSLRDAEALQLALRSLRKQPGQTAAERRDIAAFGRSLRRGAPSADKAASTLTAHTAADPGGGRAASSARCRRSWTGRTSRRGCATATPAPDGRCAACAAAEADEQFHDLRKAIKSLHYQAELLASTGHRPRDQAAQTPGRAGRDPGPGHRPAAAAGPRPRPARAEVADRPDDPPPAGRRRSSWPGRCCTASRRLREQADPEVDG